MDQKIDNKELRSESQQAVHGNSEEIAFVIDIIKKLPSLAEKKGISKQQVEALHGLGYQLYEAEYYQEAGDLFRLLCLFESRVVSHWIALGGACQHTKHHDNALAAFTMACLLDPHNPEPRFYTAHTLIDLQDLPLALHSIDMTIELCDHHPQYADLYRQSVSLRNILSMHIDQYHASSSERVE